MTDPREESEEVPRGTGRSAVQPPEWTDVTDQIEPYEGDTDRSWVILYSEDYANMMLDGEDNLAILVNNEQAHELKRLSEQAIQQTEVD